MIKAIIFDFDGTIIDTETAWYEAFREAYRQHDVELTLELYSGCIGTSLHTFNPYEYLITHRNLPIDREAFREAVHVQHAKLMERETMRPGVLSYLEKAHEAGLRIGLASSSSLKWVEKHLRQLGIYEFFEVIRTSDHVQRVKPDPELYLQALEGLGVQASEAIAIEDSPNGARAAEAAGIRCIITPNTITKALDFSSCAYWHKADSLQDVEFDRLLVRS
ncbi:putative hydrolase of the HAD superfamily [Paenibacillus sp. UNCCL117]|uniref:HAD family hydrolase n=1 Tax=unclassified Paenibacillus TaxID=185978 RepID=UPI00088D9810|nr:MULTISPECIES: HAD family hydrolase [unclassified Paenibacillus]SDC65154.1 putative hydrolase of the HAD superfamily [Paenibacillus sp. cl123]SFW22699.1 putative hydrolase of the HAD superfamily [Paenibacillus sp. UNCCL117]